MGERRDDVDGCSRGDNVRPVLPKLVLERTTKSSSNAASYSMKLDYSILSIPEPNSRLYKSWPSIRNHLRPTFPVEGPYCYEDDPNRAYAIRFSYNSEIEAMNNAPGAFSSSLN